MFKNTDRLIVLDKILCDGSGGLSPTTIHYELSNYCAKNHINIPKEYEVVQMHVMNYIRSAVSEFANIMQVIIRY